MRKSTAATPSGKEITVGRLSGDGWRYSGGVVSTAGVSIPAMVPHRGTNAARSTLRPPATDAPEATGSKQGDPSWRAMCAAMTADEPQGQALNGRRYTPTVIAPTWLLRRRYARMRHARFARRDHALNTQSGSVGQHQLAFLHLHTPERVVADQEVAVEV